MSEVSITFKAVKATKGTVVFEEVPEGGMPPYVGTLYVQKFTLQRLDKEYAEEVTTKQTANGPKQVILASGPDLTVTLS